MCPSWRERWAGEARDKAGLAYTLMGRADVGEEEGSFQIRTHDAHLWEDCH